MNKKKLILFMPTIDVGGVEKNFIIISNYLSKKFKNISVITTSENKRHKFSKNIIFISFGYFNIIKFSRRLKFFLGLILLFFEILKNKNCLVLCFQANIYCVYLCKILNTKVIIRSNSAPEGWSQSFLKKTIYKNALSLADKIIVNSIEFKKSLKRNFGVDSVCIYNPLNKSEILRLCQNKINFPFFTGKYIKFINVARFADQKDHLTLLKAFLMLKNKLNYKLLLIGDGNKKFEIEEFIKKNKMNNILIKSSVKNPFPYIKRSDVFVLASRYEGLPNVLLESIVLKKFIISSNCPTGPSEILDNGKGGLLFEPGNPKDLVRKINYYLKYKKKCKNKIIFARKRIFRFDNKKNLKDYENLIKQI